MPTPCKALDIAFPAKLGDFRKKLIPRYVIS
jgi:hypothetical protein